MHSKPDIALIDRGLLKQLDEYTKPVMRAILRTPTPCDHPLWNFVYLAEHIVTTSRHHIYEDAFQDDVERFFRPKNAAERRLCRHFACEIIHGPRGRNFFDVDESDEQVAQVFENARQQLFNGKWKRISIGPKSTPRLHALRERFLRSN